jgi:hypothetical protein
MAVGLGRHLYIPGVNASTILHFDGDGQIIKKIPIEAVDSYTSFSLDPEGNLVFFGPGHPPLGRITVLSSEDGHLLRRFDVSSWASSILPLRDGRVAIYSARGQVDERSVFELFDIQGRRLAVAHPVEDDALRIFHGRVQTGGLVAASADGDLIGVHPAKFEFVRMSSDLQILEFLRPRGSQPWSQDPAPFPDGLDPYAYEPPHERWWDTFTHIGSPFTVEDSIVLLSLWQSRGMADTSNVANLYRLPGDLLAAGLTVPHGGRIVGAGAGAVYVARNAVLRNGGSIEPLEIYEYTLRRAASNDSTISLQDR